MITTDVSRAEFTSNGIADDYVFNDGTVDIPVKEDSHIKVYVTDTGTITAENGTDKFTNVTVNDVANTAHGHTSGDIIKFGGTLPVGIVVNTNYYVRDIVGTTFKVELSVGGGVVNITTDGSSLTWTRVTTKTLGTDYTVAISTNNVATVSWMSGKRPLNNVKFYFSREVPYSQTIDLLNNSLIEAESLENQLDLIVNQTQQLNAKTDRDLRFHDNLISTDATESQASLNVTATNRANKSLKFDAQGSLGVTTINIDKAEDYVLESKSYATESPAEVNHYTGKVATAQTGVYSAKEHASGSAVTTGSAKDFAIKTDGAVSSTGEFSSKAYAQGGTGVTAASGSSKDWATLATTPSSTSTDASAKEWATGTSTHKADGSSKSWATTTGAVVTGSEFSAKEYAQGSFATGGTAKQWSQDTSATVDGTSYSSKEYSQGTQASTGGSAKDYATKVDGGVSGATSDHSAKAWSVGGTGVTDTALKGAAKEWATTTGGYVDTAEYSAKEYAIGTTVAVGSAKDWAVQAEDSAVTGSSYSSLHHAAKSAASATAAAASETAANASADAASRIFDKFDDKYLGEMADSASQGTNPTTNGTWAKDASAITVVSTSNIKVGQVVTGTGIPTSPKPNVISIAGSVVTISDNMPAAGSGVALTFTGYGIYGDFNGTKDGPALNNDGDALTDGVKYFNTTDDVMLVYDATSSTWRRMQPTTTEQGHINTVSGIQANVTTVAGISGNVTTVAGISANVTTVATNISSVNTVATNIADVIVVANDLSEAISEVETVANDLNEAVSEIDTVAASVVNVDIVGNNIANVNTVAGISANVTTVATNDSNVTTVATNDANITTVAGISANVTTVAGISTNVTTVAGVSANVTTVAGSIADVNRYANEYLIASSEPGSPSEGDLWMDTTNHVLKFHNGSSFAQLSTPTFNNLVDDSTPQLGGNLDCNGNDIVSVSNADIDIQPHGTGDTNIKNPILGSGATGYGVVPVGGIVPVQSQLSGAYSLPGSGAVSSEGWMLCDGASIPGSQTLSGNTPNLSDGRFLQGNSHGNSGGTGTNNTITLAVGNLPAHSHTVTTSSQSASTTGNASSANTGTTSANHYHNSGSNTGNHSHNTHRNTYSVNDFYAWTNVVTRSGNASTSNTGAHHHGNTGNFSANHTHGMDHSHSYGHTHGMSCANTGSGTAFSIVPTYLRVVYLIRVI